MPPVKGTKGIEQYGNFACFGCGKEFKQNRWLYNHFNLAPDCLEKHREEETRLNLLANEETNVSEGGMSTECEQIGQSLNKNARTDQNLHIGHLVERGDKQMENNSCSSDQGGMLDYNDEDSDGSDFVDSIKAVTEGHDKQLREIRNPVSLIQDPNEYERYDEMTSEGGTDEEEQEPSSEEDDEDCLADMFSDDLNMYQVPSGFDEKYLLNRRGSAKEGKQDFNSSMSGKMDPRMMSDVHLLDICKGLPLEKFGQIRDWRYKSEFVYRHKMERDKYPKETRSTIVERLSDMYGMQGLDPIVKKVQLPKLKKVVEITIHPFGENLIRLLTDPVAMQPENLLIDQNDPFRKPVVGGEDGVYDDVDTGSVYCDAWEKYCKGEQDILAALILFIDKSHVDRKGKLTQEPVMVTTSLWNRQFRNLPDAWLNLGSVPNLDHVAPRASATDKLCDYHYCLKIIMSELIAFQRLSLEQGLNWEMMINGRMQKVVLRMPMLFIIGDTEGHDKLCGRKVDRSSGKNRQCRMCDVKHEDCDKPNVKVNLTMKKDIRELRVKNNIAKLNDLAYKNVTDAFADVVFCDDERGMHGACLPDGLHSVKLGLLEKLIIRMFNLKRIRQEGPKKKSRALSTANKTASNIANKKRRQTEDEQAVSQEHSSEDSSSVINELDSEDEGEDFSDDGEMLDEEVIADDDVDRDMMVVEEGKLKANKEDKTYHYYSGEDPNDQSKRGIFDKQQCSMIDETCKQLHKQLRWQSQTDLPRTNFYTGLTNLSKMTGDERTGVLLVMLLILCIDSCQNEFRRCNTKSKDPDNIVFSPGQPGFLTWKLGQQRKSNMIKYISLSLLFDAFLQWDRIPVICVDEVVEFLPSFMEGLMTTFPKPDGTGHATIKQHLNSHHMVQEIKRMGSPKNTDSSRMECNHKVSIKIPGNNTQKRVSSFSRQCAKQQKDHRVISRAVKDHPKWIDPKRREAQEEEKRMKQMKVGNAWLIVTSKGVFKASNKKKDVTEWMMTGWKESEISGKDLLTIIREKILTSSGIGSDNEVTVHVTLKRRGVNYQANPEYGEEKASRQHWGLVISSATRAGRFYKDEEIPMHFQCILHINKKPRNPIEFDAGSKINSSGYFIIAHTLNKALHTGYDTEWEWNHGTLAEANQKLIHIARKQKVEMESQRMGGGVRRRVNRPKTRNAIVAVDVHRVKGPIVGIRDPNDRKETSSMHGNPVVGYYYFFHGQSAWSRLFVDAAREWKRSEKDMVESEEE